MFRNGGMERLLYDLSIDQGDSERWPQYPGEIIRRRYDLPLRNLARAVSVADAVAIFDNSAMSGPRLILQIEAGIPVKTVLGGERPFDRRIAEAVAGSLNSAVGSLFLPR